MKKSQKVKVTGVIIARNAEKTINNALRSLIWCSEIIVVDDFSEDSTLKIAKKFGSRVYKRKLNGDFSKQRNFAMSKAKNEWVMFVDADEFIPAETKKEILNSLAGVTKNVGGFHFKRKDIFLEHELRHGPAAQSRFLRLVRLGYGEWIGVQPEYFLLSKGEERFIKNKITHHRQEDLFAYISKANFYSTLEANARFSRGELFNVAVMIYEPSKSFIKAFVIKLGFLDGIYGFIICFMIFIIQTMVHLKLWEQSKNNE